MKVIAEQQEEVMMIFARFKGMSNACNSKKDKKSVEKDKEEAPAEPDKKNRC